MFGLIREKQASHVEVKLKQARRSSHSAGLPILFEIPKKEKARFSISFANWRYIRLRYECGTYRHSTVNCCHLASNYDNAHFRDSYLKPDNGK